MVGSARTFSTQVETLAKMRKIVGPSDEAKKKKLGTGERAENQMVKITMSTIFNTTL